MTVEHRLSWESPDAWFCADAEAQYGKNVWQRVEWSDFIPEEKWHRTEVTFTEGRFDQASTLRRWAETHEQPIRNVVLEQREIPEPESGWTLVGPDHVGDDASCD